MSDLLKASIGSQSEKYMVPKFLSQAYVQELYNIMVITPEKGELKYV